MRAPPISGSSESQRFKRVSDEILVARAVVESAVIGTERTFGLASDVEDSCDSKQRRRDVYAGVNGRSWFLGETAQIYWGSVFGHGRASGRVTRLPRGRLKR